MQVGDWLRGLGLERYERAFRDNAIDAEILPELSEADLEKLGVLLGHRKRLLKAIAALACGAASGVEPPVRESTAARSETERRQLTVMFVDLVGSTELSARLDPEEMREIVRGYRDRVAGEILRYEGHVAKFMGDGVLAYFGWPAAHEDEAERAVRAGLAIAGAVPTLDAPSGGPLAVRIGIATGLVVVGDLVGQGAAREEAVIGETPNLAARLQEVARPGGVVVAEATRRLLAGLFELADLGPRRLKGLGAPARAFAVLGERTVQDRFEARQSGTPLPLVGRDQELALLLERWRLAKGGAGQVVLLEGEPGIGKSRIVLALRERLRAEPRTTVRYNCSPFHTNSALHPAIEQLTRAAGFAAEDDAAAKFAKLEAVATRAATSEEILPYLADLAGLPAGGRLTLPPLTPQEKKARIFRALLARLEELAGQQPVLLVLEDAHWCDPTTLELFGQAIERLVSLPVLLVVTFRPEFKPPWTGHAHVTSLLLSRLGRAAARAIVDEVAGSRALPGELLDAIVGRTDGVPLFVEELTKAVLESGLVREGEGRGLKIEGAILPLAIPATLSDSLLARLDRLARVKEVAQVGAVIGREFPQGLLATVADMEAAALADALERLVAAELVFRRSTPAGPSYVFKHALVQDAAYQSLLKSRRQQLHARVAEGLAAKGSEPTDTPPEVLAHHLTEAGLLARALPAWLAAGERAWRRSAYREAIAHLRRGIETASSVPGPEGRWTEIRLRNLLGAVLLAARGPHPEVIEAYEQASRLATEAGETGELIRASWGAWSCHLERVDVPRARAIVADLLRRAVGASDDGLVLQAHHAAWTTGWVAGDLRETREHAEAGLRLCDEAEHHELTAFYGGHDAGVCSRNTLGITLWLLGFPDQAAARVDEGLALAEKLAHPFTLAITLAFATWTRLFRGDLEEARRLTQRGIELCAEQGIPVYLATGRIFEGFLQAAGGEGGTAADTILSGVRALETLGSRVRRSFYLGLLAEAHLRAGRPREGLAVVEEAQRFVAERGERWYEPELHRMRGELLLARGGGGARDEARRSFETARAIATERGARSLALRAAIRLARLDGEDGHRQRACGLLAPVYAAFTEGFRTPDLTEARALLDAFA